MSEMVQLWSYLEEYNDLRDQILSACDRVFSSGRLVLGDEGRAFESELAKSIGVSGAVGVNNGTDAIFIALAALGVGTGDEVLTVPNTAVPTVSAIGTLGAKPVFVDIGEDCLIDVEKIEAAITSKTKAIIPVHLYGQMADMDVIMEIAARRGLAVVEDCAQAQGATYNSRAAGSIGDAATISFYPTKILGAYGDAGAIVSDNPRVLDAARSLRFYGMEQVYYAERHGYNSRLDEVQAAILSIKLPYMEQWIERRRAIARRYDEAFNGSRIAPVAEAPGRRHVYHLYVVEHEQRDELIAKMAEEGIGSGVCYRWPIHIMRGYAHLNYQADDFPVAMRKADRIMNLPIYPALDDRAVERVIETVLRLA
jgi:aminotransferase EvaB